MTERAARAARVIVPALAVGLIIAVLTVYFQRGFVPGDAFTYLAAGERLNAGHPLYALSAGDRPVDLHPPYWTVPLLSPPPIAVVFRPLALLSDLGAYAWWVLCIGVIVATLVALLRQQPIWTGLMMLVLTIPIVYELGVGNLNSVIVGGLVGAWYLLTRRRDEYAGVIVAAATALKLTPGILVWWLITQRRWRALGAFVVGGLVLLATSVAGAGFDSHVEYLSIIRQTATTGTSDLSLAGLARAVGLSEATGAALPLVALAVGTLSVWLLRARPGAAWVASIATMLAASPVVNVNWFTLLLVALAPLAWRMESIRPPLYRPGARAIDPSASE
ncbi:MAG: DUF2029 domain-containing protein [Chloroflexi bacterium]|nr:DUF2029 domain-containing protein [Chloroflexota bacterium]